MKTKFFCITTLWMVFLYANALAQYEYEWNVHNTFLNAGERVIAVIDAGTIGTYDGIGIVGEVFDDKGNWGYALPIRSDFQMYLKFSRGAEYEIVQERKTPNIELRIRKISDSIYHLTALCPVIHRSVSVKFDRVISHGIASFSLGSPDLINTSGTLVIDEPTYTSYVDGKLGIGTPNPGNELEVNGTIRSKEVIVEATGWPDYVFEEGYDLPTLKELEAFIKARKHLPEVPSAQEIENQGQHLGAMNMLLLKKIEELTLYTIEQEQALDERLEMIEKEKSVNKSQQEVLNTQQELIAQLVKRIEQLESKK